jgi:hypothetical protein
VSILGPIRKAHDAEASTESILEGTIILRAIRQREVPHAMLLTPLVPVTHILCPVLITVSTSLHDTTNHCNIASPFCNSGPMEIYEIDRDPEGPEK